LSLWTNSEVPNSSPNLMSDGSIITFRFGKVMNGKQHSRQTGECMSHW
jgi:hypothetical protein